LYKIQNAEHTNIQEAIITTIATTLTSNFSQIFLTVHVS